jgi:hypothetical protein
MLLPGRLLDMLLMLTRLRPFTLLSMLLLPVLIRLALSLGMLLLFLLIGTLLLVSMLLRSCLLWVALFLPRMALLFILLLVPCIHRSLNSEKEGQNGGARNPNYLHGDPPLVPVRPANF